MFGFGKLATYDYFAHVATALRQRFDDAGEEHALPDNYRVITRFLGGSIMLVTKGSIWNGLSITYDALHDSMSSEEIRLFIQRLIYRRGAPSFATPR